MDNGWILLAGAAALGVAAVLAVRLLAEKTAADRTSVGNSSLLLGPVLIALGIIFGDDPVVGYSLIASGVIISIVVTWQRGIR